MNNDNDGGRKTFICLQWYDRSITKHIINFTRTVLELGSTQPGEGTCGRGLHPTFTFEQEF